jgi:hypothetical protein
VGQDAKGMFYLMMGSWMGEWDTRDNLLRAALAAPNYGLASFYAGRPHWFFHHMALGEPIGYGARVTMNNRTLYRNQVNDDTRGVHVGLMGDPTLRMHPVAPADNLRAARASSGVDLSWIGSPDASVGYHVYRAANPSGPFTRVTAKPLRSTSYRDGGAQTRRWTYMVRAIRLEQTPSGSFYNPSQGVFTRWNPN